MHDPDLDYRVREIERRLAWAEAEFERIRLAGLRLAAPVGLEAAAIASGEQLPEGVYGPSPYNPSGVITEIEDDNGVWSVSAASSAYETALAGNPDWTPMTGATFTGIAEASATGSVYRNANAGGGDYGHLDLAGSVSRSSNDAITTGPYKYVYVVEQDGTDVRLSLLALIRGPASVDRPLSSTGEGVSAIGTAASDVYANYDLDGGELTSLSGGSVTLDASVVMTATGYEAFITAQGLSDDIILRA